MLMFLRSLKFAHVAGNHMYIYTRRISWRMFLSRSLIAQRIYLSLTSTYCTIFSIVSMHVERFAVVVVEPRACLHIYGHLDGTRFEI